MTGPSPLLGYNTNIRHKGVLCHVQTEDSGVGHPHVITHLFTAGTILATKKRSYAEHVGSADIELVVRKLMQEQHKLMCVELRDGAFDVLLTVGDTQKIAVVRDVPVAEAEALPTPPDQPPVMPPPPAGRTPVPALLSESMPSEQHLPADADTPPPPPPVRGKPALPAASTYQAATKETIRTPTPAPRVRPPTPPPFTRGAAARTPAPASRSPVPTPSRSPVPTPSPASRSPVSTPSLAAGSPVSTPSPAARGEGTGKRGPLFGAGRAPPPPPERASIFGQEHISEKSLDEVILAYLSEEVDE